jgi:catechol 2,3-dioxygenase-like lactoylglutathione lyase family enzyme
MYKSIGISHIGFRVDNLDDTIEKIEKLGGKLVIPPFSFVPKITFVTDHEDEKLKRASIPFNSNRSWKIAGFSDPDGIILEIIER